MLCSVVQCIGNIILTCVVLLLEPLHGYVIASWFVLCRCSIVRCRWVDHCDKWGARATILPSGRACKTLHWQRFMSEFDCGCMVYCLRVASTWVKQSNYLAYVHNSLLKMLIRCAERTMHASEDINYVWWMYRKHTIEEYISSSILAWHILGPFRAWPNTLHDSRYWLNYHVPCLIYRRLQDHLNRLCTCLQIET